MKSDEMEKIKKLLKDMNMDIRKLTEELKSNNIREQDWKEEKDKL